MINIININKIYNKPNSILIILRYISTIVVRMLHPEARLWDKNIINPLTRYEGQRSFGG